MDLHELGTFLRSRRNRIQPAEVGLPHGTRRRVTGLRRDEVAVLAGASVDYYNQLEQGRGAQPSEQMLAALARALRLTEDERDYLFLLAGRPAHSAGIAQHVHPGMLDLIQRLPDTPAAVISDLHVTLIQNPLGTALLGAQPHDTGLTSSFVYRWFTEPDARRRYHEDEHDHQSKVMVADLRAVVARRANDDDVTSLIGSLRLLSDEFRDLWSKQDVAVRRKDRKRLVHPTVGTIELDCLSLLSEDGSQRLLWFTPPAGSEAVEQLRLLAVVGTQDLDATSPSPSGNR